MRKFSSRSDTARGASEPRREGEDSAPRLRIESVREGASGTASVAAGGSVFLVNLEQLESLGLAASVLAPGTELDEAGEFTIRLASEAHEAERRGLALLARAEQSTFLLRGKLEARGFSKSSVSLALERLSTQHWLDDRRFARAYAASRLARRPEGPASLTAALRARGIDADTAKSALAEVFDPESRKEALARAYVRESKKAKNDEDETRSRLRALGFTSSEITAYREERFDASWKG